MDKQLQLIEEFLGTSSIEVHPTTVLANLAIAAFLASVLRVVYVRFGTSLSNRRMFAANFILLACTTTLIITVVKSSLALSLGLVGALSIVRFRSAIKEPEELSYLFLTIAIGLGLGADQWKLTIPAFGLIVGLNCLGSIRGKSRAKENFFLTISSPQGTGVGLSQIVGVLSSNCRSLNLRRFDERPDAVEASFQIEFDGPEQLEAGTAELRRLNDQMHIAFSDNRGII